MEDGLVSCSVVKTVGDLEGLAKLLRQQGAKNDTPLFTAADEEGNQFAHGFDIGYYINESFEYGGIKSPLGTVIVYPGGVSAEPLSEWGTRMPLYKVYFEERYLRTGTVEAKDRADLAKKVDEWNEVKWNVPEFVDDDRCAFDYRVLRKGDLE